MAKLNSKSNTRKTYCIMCGEEKNGIEIKIDNVITSIRFIKKKLFHSEKNNKLVVCKNCYPNYTKNRKRYVSRQRLYIGLGVVFLIFSVLLAPNFGTFLIGLAVLLLLYLLSFLNYTPELLISSTKTKNPISRLFNTSNKKELKNST
ncbi:MAG: hypothetical protein QXD23_00440 [Candidatus Micrarchaeaceae archaeon]